MYSPEENAELAGFRAKAAQGALTQADLTRVVQILRQGRLTAVQNSAKKRSVAAKATRSADDLLGELEG